MRDVIMNHCMKKLNFFSSMTDAEIYNWICSNFFIRDFVEARECSWDIWKASRNKT